MNERIKQLAKQAGDYVNEVYTPPVRSKTPGKIWEDGHIGWNEQFQAKFAELIIEECATLVDSAFDIDEHSGEVVSYADGGQLKKHFGIES
jgi:hypothetical protein